MNRNTIIIAGSVVVAGLIVVLSRRARRHTHDIAPGSLDDRLRDLEHASRTGRRARRNSPRADGHATPAGGQGRPTTAPSYFEA